MVLVNSQVFNVHQIVQLGNHVGSLADSGLRVTQVSRTVTLREN